MNRLWDKGADLDLAVHRFTVGDDPHWDLHLVHWDCLGSAAHVLTLEKADVLTTQERGRLIVELRRIDELDREGKFAIPDALEDCHTAIEAHLTAALGEAGEKIHTGRSRNDQVATAMRLYMRHRTLDWLDLLVGFSNTLLDRIRRDGDVAMPGYTHMQPAMPSSVGLWLHAFAEAALEQMRAALDLLERLDSCPLGTGAGFGVALPLDRAFTARLLGFSRAQRSPIDVQNSRGRMETYFVRVGCDIASMLEKLSWDLILFSSREYGFFSLPEAMTTGSSIMPQKNNPDVLELMRARAGRMRGRLHELEWIAGKLPSSYHRDLQLTKEPAIRTGDEVAEMLGIAGRVVKMFTLKHDALKAAMIPELFATDAALALVKQGLPFRQAYRQIAAQCATGKWDATMLSRAMEDSGGRVARSDVEACSGEVAALAAQADTRRGEIQAVESSLLGGG